MIMRHFCHWGFVSRYTRRVESRGLWLGMHENTYRSVPIKAVRWVWCVTNLAGWEGVMEWGVKPSAISPFADSATVLCTDLSPANPIKWRDTKYFVHTLPRTQKSVRNKDSPTMGRVALSLETSSTSIEFQLKQVHVQLHLRLGVVGWYHHITASGRSVPRHS
jgi:hypothetical protein